MKISDVRIRVVEFDVLKGSDSIPDRKSVCFVQVIDESGEFGTGFSSHHTKGVSLIAYAIADWCDLIIGREANSIRSVWGELVASKIFRLDRGGVATKALSALDIALWDLLAKRLDAPLWQVLGGGRTQGPAVYSTLRESSACDLDAAIEHSLDKGCIGVKIKVGGGDWKAASSTLRKLRATHGFSFKLMVDANQRWDLHNAVRFWREVEDLEIEWLEEPFPLQTLHVYQELAARTECPVAVGENFNSSADFLRFAESRSVRFLQPDVTALRGITEWLTVAELSRAFELELVPHHGDFCQVQRHLALLAPNCGLMEAPWAVDIFEDVASIIDGRFAVPTAAGAGTSPREGILLHDSILQL